MTTNLQEKIAEDLGRLFDQKLREALFHHVEMARCAELSHELIIGYPIFSVTCALATLAAHLTDEDRKFVLELVTEQVTQFNDKTKQRKAHGRGK